MREKRGKFGIKVVLCEVLAAGEREREERWKTGNFPGIWDFPRDLGVSGMRRIPEERGGVSEE